MDVDIKVWNPEKVTDEIIWRGRRKQSMDMVMAMTKWSMSDI